MEPEDFACIQTAGSCSEFSGITAINNITMCVYGKKEKHCVYK